MSKGKEGDIPAHTAAFPPGNADRFASFPLKILLKYQTAQKTSICTENMTVECINSLHIALGTFPFANRTLSAPIPSLKKREI